jgi:hypothetical protein
MLLVLDGESPALGFGDNLGVGLWSWLEIGAGVTGCWGRSKNLRLPHAEILLALHSN